MTMDPKLRNVLLILALLSCVSVWGQIAAAPASQSEFEALIDRYYAAWNTGNPDNAAPLYAKGADLVFYDLTPLKYTGWANYDKGVRQVLGSFASATFKRNQDLRVTRHGTIAWTTVTWHLSGKKKTGDSVELDGRHTAIWEKRGSKWLIVHEHFSVPLS
jgi:ketosteroid isomerase-like protein